MVSTSELSMKSISRWILFISRNGFSLISKLFLFEFVALVIIIIWLEFKAVHFLWFWIHIINNIISEYLFIYSIGSDLVERTNWSKFKTLWNNNSCNFAFMLNLFAAYKCKKNSSWRNVKSVFYSATNMENISLKILMRKYLLKNTNKIWI